MKYIVSLFYISVFSYLSYNLFKVTEYKEYKKAKKKSNYQIILINPIRGNIFDSNGLELTSLNYSYKLVYKGNNPNLYDIDKCTQYEDGKVNVCTVTLDYFYDNLELLDIFPLNIYPVFKRTKNFYEPDFDFIGNSSFATDMKKNKIIRKIIKALKKKVQDTGLIKRAITKFKYLDILSGHSGLELYYDPILLGKIGIAKRYRDKSITLIDKKSGEDIYLTLDLRLQKMIKDELVSFCKNLDTNCSTVGINAKNGDIIFFVDVKKDNLSKPVKQFHFSNIYQGLYSPGSILKPFVALEFLEKNIITKKSYNFCPGKIILYNRIFNCWAHTGHGKINLISAIEQSCNVFFYQNIQKLNIDGVKNFIKRFAMNRKTHIDLPNEALPRISMPINPLNKILFSIGQIDIYLSLLKLSQLYSLFYNGKYIPVPNIAKRKGFKFKESHRKRKMIFNVDVKTDNVKLVKEALYKVVHSKIGTAHGLGLEKYKLYGKTGTVQVGKNLKPHSLFCGVWEYKVPISFCVLIENSGSGKDFAAKFTRRLIAIIEQFYPNK